LDSHYAVLSERPPNVGKSRGNIRMKGLYVFGYGLSGYFWIRPNKLARILLGEK
jgi:hypothetical protein